MCRTLQGENKRRGGELLLINKPAAERKKRKEKKPQPGVRADKSSLASLSPHSSPVAGLSHRSLGCRCYFFASQESEEMNGAGGGGEVGRLQEKKREMTEALAVVLDWRSKH